MPTENRQVWVSGEPSDANRVALLTPAFAKLTEITRGRMPLATTGALIGTVRRFGGQEWTIIEDVCPIDFEPTEAKPAPDAGEWDGARPLRSSRAPRSRHQVGWFYADSSLGASSPRIDPVRTQLSLEPDATILLVTNPATNEGAFYIWQDGCYTPAGGFYTLSLAEGEAAPAIPWGGEFTAASEWLAPAADVRFGDQAGEPTRPLGDLMLNAERMPPAEFAVAEELSDEPMQADPLIAPQSGVPAEPLWPAGVAPAIPIGRSRELPWQSTELAFTSRETERAPAAPVSEDILAFIAARPGAETALRPSITSEVPRRGAGFSLMILAVLLGLAGALAMLGGGLEHLRATSAGPETIARVAPAANTPTVAAPPSPPAIISETPSLGSRPATAAGAAEGALAMPSPTPSISAEQSQSLEVAGQTVHYLVRRGDNLSSIAWRYGTSVPALMAANQLVSTTIYPEQVLLIPTGR